MHRASCYLLAILIALPSLAATLSYLSIRYFGAHGIMLASTISFTTLLGMAIWLLPDQEPHPFWREEELDDEASDSEEEER